MEQQIIETVFSDSAGCDLTAAKNIPFGFFSAKVGTVGTDRRREIFLKIPFNFDFSHKTKSQEYPRPIEADARIICVSKNEKGYHDVWSQPYDTLFFEDYRPIKKLTMMSVL
jgi:hypothetical protein